MAAKNDWIEDVRRWCFEAPMADVDALAADVAAATARELASSPSEAASHGEAVSDTSMGRTAFVPYARGSGFDRALSRLRGDF